MYLMQGRVLKTLARIPSHEDAQAAGWLVRVVAVEVVPVGEDVDVGYWHGGYDPYIFKNKDVTRHRFLKAMGGSQAQGAEEEVWISPQERVLFISHTWLQRDHPDNPECQKLRQLQATVLDDDFVMLDFFSFPQTSPPQQAMAIRSLQYYIYHCDFLVVLHNSENEVNKEHLVRYFTRGWCNLELLTAFSPLPEVQSETFEQIDDSSCRHFKEKAAKFCYCCSVLLDLAPLSAETAVEWLQHPAQAAFSFESDREHVAQLCSKLLEQFQAADIRKNTTRKKFMAVSATQAARCI
eukprot:m.201215 g.201215  ORF g.201215 m.201215 type:complete len:294 (-) comp21933_c0_seq1:667-1548(-)